MNFQRAGFDLSQMRNHWRNQAPFEMDPARTAAQLVNEPVSSSRLTDTPHAAVSVNHSFDTSVVSQKRMGLHSK